MKPSGPRRPIYRARHKKLKDIKEECTTHTFEHRIGAREEFTAIDSPGLSFYGVIDNNGLHGASTSVEVTNSNYHLVFFDMEQNTTRGLTMATSCVRSSRGRGVSHLSSRSCSARGPNAPTEQQPHGPGQNINLQSQAISEALHSRHCLNNTFVPDLNGTFEPELRDVSPIRLPSCELYPAYIGNICVSQGHHDTPFDFGSLPTIPVWNPASQFYEKFLLDYYAQAALQLFEISSSWSDT